MKPGYFSSMLIVFSCWFGVLLSAAASDNKANLYAEKLPLLSSNANILLLPFFDNELLQGEEAKEVATALKTELASYGYRVTFANFKSVPPERDPEKLLESYPAIVSEFYENSDSIQKARSVLIKVFAHPGELVVIPTVVQREAKLKGELAQWDGFSQKLRSRGTSDDFVTWSGSIVGLSLRLDGFAPDGTWLFTSFGGISLPVSANVKTRKYERKEALFAEEKDKKALDKGVTKACYPLRKHLKI